MILLMVFQSFFIVVQLEIPSLLLLFTYGLVFGKAYLVIVQFKNHVTSTMKDSVVCYELLQ